MLTYAITAFVLQLITHVKEKKRKFLREDDRFDGVEFHKDFSTIKVNGGRRSGHTTALAHLSKSFDCILYVAPAKLMFDTFKSACASQGISYKNVVPAWPIHSIPSGYKYDAVFVDNASHFSKEDIEKLYQSFRNNKDIIFIFVG